MELNGCFWHAHEKCFPGKVAHSAQRRKDMRRYTLFWRQGHKVLVIWECEVKNAWDDVKTKLRRAAGIAA